MSLAKNSRTNVTALFLDVLFFMFLMLQMFIQAANIAYRFASTYFNILEIFLTS